jgi:hypothetical protein
MTVDLGNGSLTDAAGEQPASARVTATSTPHFPARSCAIRRLSKATLKDKHQMRITWVLQ